MVWLVVQPVRVPLAPGSRVKLGSVPISCSCKHSVGDRGATADTTQGWLTADGMLKGEVKEGDGGGSRRDCGHGRSSCRGSLFNDPQGRRESRGRGPQIAISPHKHSSPPVTDAVLVCRPRPVCLFLENELNSSSGAARVSQFYRSLASTTISQSQPSATPVSNYTVSFLLRLSVPPSFAAKCRFYRQVQSEK